LRIYCEYSHIYYTFYMARRKKQYSVITRKGSPYWQYRLEGWTGYKPSPILIKLRSGEPRNKSEAEEWAAEEWRRKGGKEQGKHGKTLREFLAPFFIPGLCPHMARVLSDTGRYSTKWAKEQRRRLDMYILADDIADIEIEKLRPGHFEDFKQRLRVTEFSRPVGKDKERKYVLSNRTVNIIVGTLKTAIAEGYHRGEIDSNPTVGVRKIREDPEETGIFTPEEVRRIITEPELFTPPTRYYGVVRGRQPEHLAYVFLTVLALVGERPNAILSLRWGDIEGDVLSFSQTKTTQGRIVPVPRFVATLLEQLKDTAVRTDPEDWVFGYEDGTQCSRTWYLKRFNAMMKRAGFPEKDAEGRKRVPYSLKHSLITHLIDAGADEVLVREFVGHSHGYGTSRILTRVQATYKHRQAERLREILPWVERIYEAE